MLEVGLRIPKKQKESEIYALIVPLYLYIKI
jgi:hypothetical protein